ncbi:MAG: DNA polymerase III subunit alpha [Candidatus Berkelbacteria bacterium]|nr:MAG: DNA polymerase III subunit alpha [Candidatus Berkelbacteria bacterium]QQG51618.1 MAG: DNA polymerase III subunit alpha [Candidatus Berkelbacteria bacterium]
MAKPNFVHLHVHSHYSLLDGLGKIDQLVGKAKALGMPALALTDHGVMHGTIEFYLECKKAGIKPIIGQEAYVAPRKRTDKSTGQDNRPYHLVLLAKNLTGYKNLIKLTSLGHLEGYYYRPRLDREILSRYSEGLIATSACLASETSRIILGRDQGDVEETIRTYQEIFGKENYYLELQDHPGIAEQQVVNQRIKELAKKTGLGLIATNDTHYVNPEDHNTHDILVCIQTGRLVSDRDRMLYTGDFSLKTAEEISEAFPDVPEALENTLKIADMVNLDIPLDQNLLPQFPLPPGETEASLLKKWCEEGLRKRYSEITLEIRERLNYELETVNKMGFPGYFLIVADFMRMARSKGILVGPGRGSAAGSLIAYATGITNVDPLYYGLLFERFLDPSRVSMPDIDMDFEDKRRGEVIDYVRDKYGDDRVAGIITFGTIMARAAVRDVGRVLGVPYNQVDAIAKVVPAPIQGRHIPLAKSVKDSPELKEVYDKDPEAKQLLDQAMKLEGTIRHASQHACAIVISKEPLDQYVAVQAAQGGDIHQVTQYSMGPIEKIGLLKMDFLGLANLSIMKQAIEIIEAVHATKVDIDNLPLDDTKTFALLGRGETTGVFQLESAGMKRYIKELKPNLFNDIVAMVALYRPGPIQWIQTFINRKHAIENIEYMHPLTENALKETYGIPVYQEQVMRMSRDMCGFTGSEADTLRKAIGKKIPKLMKEMKEKFISGAVNNGVGKSKAEEIWDQLEDFAAYAFPKAHAVCYAMIAFQTAYLKAHYPDCFMAALMTSDLGDIDRISIEIAECERMGITVLPPDVNESFADFGVVKHSKVDGDKKSIRFGLGAIKNLGVAVAKQIVTERKTNGAFETLEDFLSRCCAFLNKKVLESLVKSGALDRFGSRASLFAGVEFMVKAAAGSAKNNGNGQALLFEATDPDALKLPKIDLPNVPDDKRQNLTWEKELLGLYLSDHPLKEFSELLAQAATPCAEIVLGQAGTVVRIGGVIHEVKKITTKSNQMMGFARIEDLTGTLEAVVFPTIFAEQKEMWQNDQMVLVEGKLSDKDGEAKVLVDKVWALDKVNAEDLEPIVQRSSNSSPYLRNRTPQERPTSDTGAHAFVVDLPKEATKETMEKLKNILLAHPGETAVELRVINHGELRNMRAKLTVKDSPALRQAVSELITPVR